MPTTLPCNTEALLRASVANVESSRPQSYGRIPGPDDSLFECPAHRPTHMKDLRRTALISAALMGIQPLWVLVFAIRRFVISPHLLQWSWQWPFLLSATTDLIWLVALPTLFFLLYLTAATLPVSRRQRSLAAVMALLQTVSVLISLWTRGNVILMPTGTTLH